MTESAGPEPKAGPVPGEKPRPPIRYSIRIPATLATVVCPHCRKEFPAGGPTGFAEDEAICDRCLLKADQQLGMVLALIGIVRRFATSCPLDTEDMRKPISQVLGGDDPGLREALGWVGAFAYVYHCFASQHGPARDFAVEEPPANS